MTTPNYVLLRMSSDCWYLNSKLFSSLSRRFGRLIKSTRSDSTMINGFTNKVSKN